MTLDTTVQGVSEINHLNITNLTICSTSCKVIYFARNKVEELSGIIIWHQQFCRFHWYGMLTFDRLIYAIIFVQKNAVKCWKNWGLFCWGMVSWTIYTKYFILTSRNENRDARITSLGSAMLRSTEMQYSLHLNIWCFRKLDGDQRRREMT